MGGEKWLSRSAVLWAMDEAPDVPARLVATLIAVARYAHDDGRGAYPAASAIASITRKSKSQAKRDMAALEKLGLLLPGDQRQVKDIRPDRRPKVYDLPMSRGASERTPYEAHLDGPRRSSRGASGNRTGRSSLQNGVHPDAPEEVLKTSGTGERASGASAPSHSPPVADAHARAADDQAAEVMPLSESMAMIHAKMDELRQRRRP